MDVPPIPSKRVLLGPPGTVQVRLDDGHRRLYRRVYARYMTIFENVPALTDRDFDGRPVRMSASQLRALQDAFAAVAADGDDDDPTHGSTFDAQAHGRSRLFKRLQYLS
jgi:hypothetical protein